MAQKASSGSGHWYRVETTQFEGPQNYDLNTFLTWKGSEHMFKNNGLLLLKSIDLSSNYFLGEIPKEFEILIELISLNLSRNNLSGKIPPNIGKLTSLEFFDISRNQLVGSIPISLTQIDRLSMLDLSHNHLIGKIPQSTQLQSFNSSCYEDNLDLCGPPLDKMCISELSSDEKRKEIHEDDYSFFNREFYISMPFGFIISFWTVIGLMIFRSSSS